MEKFNFFTKKIYIAREDYPKEGGAVCVLGLDSLQI